MFRVALTLSAIGLLIALALGKDNKKQTGKQTDPALAALAANAARPGDESLRCEALQKELVTAGNNSTLQAYLAKSGAEAQKQVKAMSDAKPQMGAQAAISAFSSLAPGGAWASVMAGKAQAPMQQAQTAQNLQRHMQQMNELMAIMPLLMRGQRVLELAQTRKCEWLESGKLSTGHEAEH